MSLLTLEDIIARHPTEKRAIQRLVDLIDKPGANYEADRLYSRVQPSSERAFNQILFEAIEAGILDSFAIVESSAGGKLEQFQSVSDIPNEIDDWQTGQRVKVRPENIRIYFKRKGL